MESAIVQLGAAKALEQRFIKGANLWVGRLFWAPAKMHRGVCFPTFHLAFLQKAQTGNEESDHRRGTMHLQRESSGGARLVMIFEEARGMILIIPVRLKVFAHGSTEPLDSNSSSEGRAKNRRVEIVLGTTATSGG